MTTERLKSELTVDPLGRGYAGMGDAAVLADLFTEYRFRDQSLIATHEILTVLDDADLTALSAADHRKLLLFMSVGVLDVSNQRVREAFKAIFSGRTGALTRLQGLEKKAISRAIELGLGRLRLGHIQVARS